MNNYERLNSFFGRLIKKDLDYLINEFENERNLLDEKCKYLINNRLNDEGAYLIIYKQDIEYILYGLRNIKDKNLGGWPDHIGNDIQRERNNKL